MKLATWNINGLRARMDFVMHWLRERQPDVVGLQELKMSEDKFPHLQFQAEGYHALVHGQKSWNGVAILTRTPVEHVNSGLAGQEDFGARLITADVGDIRFTTVYCPNGKNLAHADYAGKLRWYDALIEYVEQTHDATRASMLCGDMNICPTGLDSWNEDRFRDDIFHTVAERERFARLLGTGHVDVYREREPDTQAFSWWDYRGGAFHRKMGLRIDFLLASQPLMARVRDVYIDRDYRKKIDGMTASDHAPVIAEIA